MSPLRVEFLLKTESGYQGMRKVLDSPWQILSIEASDESPFKTTESLSGRVCALAVKSNFEDPGERWERFWMRS